MKIKLIVGIGNQGSEYTNTRHNFGYKYVQLLASTYNVKLKKNNFLSGYFGELKICDSTIRLLIPNGYINNSGLSIAKCVNYYHLSLQELLVAHDELDLAPGTVRIKLGKKINESHHGIQDIINKLNNSFDFYRLRIGIGRPKNKNETINFVLSQPSIYDNNKIYCIIKKVISHTENIVFGDFVKVMNELHSH